MAQDMGDDIGERIFRLLGRAVGYGMRRFLADYQRNAEQWTRQRFIENGMDPTQAQAQAQAAAAREAVCVPFGGAQDAALFAQMCRQDGVYAMPLTDPQGNGFLQFAVADLDRMQSTISRFAQEVARQHEQWIGETLRQPVSPEKLPQLREIPITDRPRTAPEQAPAQEHAAQAQETPSRTQTIAEKVKDARDHCTNFEDFRQRLAEQGIGVTTTMTGELMFYEARMGADGQLLPFEHRQDWSVGADTLQKNYGVDARQDWFTRNRPMATDGSLDQRGETPDLNQGIRSHDGMDTDTRTMRIEREQNGTDVPPSKVREEKAYSLDSEAKAARDASKQLAKESGQAQEHVTDISDKLNPVR